MVVLLSVAAAGLGTVVAAGVVAALACRRARRRRRESVVLVLHPFCDAGGGGERVLWCALKRVVRETQRVRNGIDNHARWRVVVATGDDAPASDIFARARTRFGEGSSLTEEEASHVELLRLRTRWLVLAETWPHLTLLGQSLGSIVMGLEALVRVGSPPDVFVDTMGYAFTYPAARVMAGAHVAAYVHYPTISSDMLRRVVDRRPTYNNAERVAASSTLTSVKLAYYRFFSGLYRFVGAFASVVMVNSSWTLGHIAELWGGSPRVVYPPCLSEAQVRASASSRERERDRVRQIISIGQFRPEKDHRLQLSCVAELRKRGVRAPDWKLVMVGSVRDQGDERRVQDLRAFATTELGLVEGSDFEFRISIDRAAVEELLRTSLVGIHTMWNEHFGIGVVEMMAAGVVVVAHDSGGPRSDIVSPGATGFLASDAASYADAVQRVGRMSPPELASLRDKALQSSARFTEEAFSDGVWACLGIVHVS